MYKIDVGGIVQVFKEFELDMRYNILPILVYSLVVIIYAFSMMFLSIFILMFAGILHILRFANRILKDFKFK